jgi:hypothetical protein
MLKDFRWDSPVAMFLGAVVYLIILVPTCIAINETDRENLRLACGTLLLDIAITDVVIATAGVLLYLSLCYGAESYIGGYQKLKENGTNTMCGYQTERCEYLVSAIALLVVGCTSLGIYIDALTKTGCEDALYHTKSATKTHEEASSLGIMVLIYGWAYATIGLGLAYSGICLRPPYTPNDRT